MSDGTIGSIILVASGKGGVGKSTVATNLALALSGKDGSEHKVGLLDADIYGPSIPTMLGAAQKPGSPDGKRIFPIEKHGIKLISMGYLVDQEVAMMWRGPMLAGAAMQFVNDVTWGDLDYLVFDLPPGTGDIQLSLAAQLKVTGAILVTTPQQVALADVVRAKTMFDKVNVPTMGVVENMSYFVCGTCEERHHLFGEGGGKRLAEQMKLPLLAEIPLDNRVRACGDEGTPIVRADPGSPSAKVFTDLADRVRDLASKQEEQKERKRGLRIIQ